MDFVFPVEHRVKIKESKKRDQLLVRVREMKKANKLWNLEVTGKCFRFGALGTVPKDLQKRLEERVIRGIQTIQAKELVRSAQILSASECC